MFIWFFSHLVQKYWWPGTIPCINKKFSFSFRDCSSFSVPCDITLLFTSTGNGTLNNLATDTLWSTIIIMCAFWIYWMSECNANRHLLMQRYVISVIRNDSYLYLQQSLYFLFVIWNDSYLWSGVWLCLNKVGQNDIVVFSSWLY